MVRFLSIGEACAVRSRCSIISRRASFGRRRLISLLINKSLFSSFTLRIAWFVCLWYFRMRSAHVFSCISRVLTCDWILCGRVATKKHNFRNLCVNDKIALIGGRMTYVKNGGKLYSHGHGKSLILYVTTVPVVDGHQKSISSRTYASPNYLDRVWMQWLRWQIAKQSYVVSIECSETIT